MVLVVNLRYGYDEESVVLADVAPHECGGAVGAATTCYQEFLEEGILKIRHLRLIKT